MTNYDTTPVSATPRLLVVGAGGFIGGFIARQSLERGFDTYVAVRSSTSRKYLDDERLHIVELDYDSSPEDMARVLAEALPSGESWQYIIYNLGATKCVNFADFNKINYLYLRTFVEALRLASLIPQRFLYVSSLSALGPGDEKNYTPLSDSMIPAPDTRYGVSKIKAETFLETCADIPWTIFRPTGVYGPHEKDYLMMIKSIDSHFDFTVGFRRQMLTFIYVDDLVDAMFLALPAPAALKKKYIIAENRAYSQAEFRSIVAKELGRKFVLPVKLPLWALYAASVVCEKYGVARMQPSTLNRDKYRIMRQRNWCADITPAVNDFGFNPQWSLRRGIKATVEAYLKEKELSHK